MAPAARRSSITCDSCCRARRRSPPTRTRRTSSDSSAGSRWATGATARTASAGVDIAYDVNAVLVPAALEAAAQLNDSGLLSPYLSAAERALFARASQMARTWRAESAATVRCRLARTAAADAIEAYAASQGIAAQPALAALGADDLRFHALALEPSGKPIPVMHSDEGFALLFAEPDARQRGPRRHGADAPVSGGPDDGGRHAGRQSGILCAVAAGAVQPQRLPRHGRMVVAAGPVRRGPGAAVAARAIFPPAVRAHLVAAQRVCGRRSTRRAR